MIKLTTILILLLFGNILSAQVQFSERLDLGKIDKDKLDEISGMDISRINKDVIWIHNDSGSEAELYAIDIKGNYLGKLLLTGLAKGIRDWEDITVGPGPVNGVSYIYIGEIGDNDAIYDSKYIYRFPEPKLNLNEGKFKIDINDFDVIEFNFPDGKRDSETLMIDPITKDLIVISKREDNVNVYNLKYPQPTDVTLIPKKIATLPFGYQGFRDSGVTGGDISNDGSEILIKDYFFVYYYTRKDNESIETALSRDYNKVTTYFYDMSKEPQGESICWDNESTGFFTSTEVKFNITPHLYFFKKIPTKVKKKP